MYTVYFVNLTFAGTADQLVRMKLTVLPRIAVPVAHKFEGRMPLPHTFVGRMHTTVGWSCTFFRSDAQVYRRHVMTGLGYGGRTLRSHLSN